MGRTFPVALLVMVLSGAASAQKDKPAPFTVRLDPHNKHELVVERIERFSLILTTTWKLDELPDKLAKVFENSQLGDYRTKYSSPIPVPEDAAGYWISADPYAELIYKEQQPGEKPISLTLHVAYDNDLKEGEDKNYRIGPLTYQLMWRTSLIDFAAWDGQDFPPDGWIDACLYVSAVLDERTSCYLLQQDTSYRQLQRGPLLDKRWSVEWEDPEHEKRRQELLKEVIFVVPKNGQHALFFWKRKKGARVMVDYTVRNVSARKTFDAFLDGEGLPIELTYSEGGPIGGGYTISFPKDTFVLKPSKSSSR